jgi:hypothetical protein
MIHEHVEWLYKQFHSLTSRYVEQTGASKLRNFQRLDVNVITVMASGAMQREYGYMAPLDTTPCRVHFLRHLIVHASRFKKHIACNNIVARVVVVA